MSLEKKKLKFSKHQAMQNKYTLSDLPPNPDDVFNVIYKELERVMYHGVKHRKEAIYSRVF